MTSFAVVELTVVLLLNQFNDFILYFVPFSSWKPSIKYEYKKILRASKQLEKDVSFS